MPVFCQIDDKHIPLYRILWMADLPHFCGDENCHREGQYELRLDQGESLWANPAQRDTALDAWEAWLQGRHESDEAS